MREPTPHAHAAVAQVTPRQTAILNLSATPARNTGTWPGCAVGTVQTLGLRVGGDHRARQWWWTRTRVTHHQERRKHTPSTTSAAKENQSRWRSLPMGRISLWTSTLAVTIISEKTYHKLWPQQRPPILPATTSLKTYTGELIQVRGSISLDVQHNGQSMVVPAVVVRGSRHKGCSRTP